ncbi:translocation/assembly module TamB [Bisgaard Taxon 10/6]|uniref:autotransporter assembly complex protein TamB n=1 Tax=Exercitatus varius TaxID=67857 RepID=UPI00294AC78E|nr:translocation/assembly module TamB domain-containing protein [Exercitatus varius]MDG2961193.1 translocation/assembly module TamB [Exercitatus varius]
MTEQEQKPAQSAVKKREVFTARKPSRIRKIFCRSLLATAVLAGLTVAGLSAVIGTESGTKWALGLADKWLDGLTVGEVSGRLQQGLTLKNTAFITDGVDVRVSYAHLRLDFGCLWRREICVEDIQIRQPQVAVNTALIPPSQEEPEAESAPPERLNLPISVTVKNIGIDETSVAIDNNRLSLAHFKSAVSLNGKNGLTLAPTVLEGFNFRTTTTAKEQAEQAKREAEQAAEKAQPMDWAALERTLTPAFLGELNEIILPFDIHITDIEGKDWSYEARPDDAITQNIRIPELHIQADATGYDVALQTFSVNSSLGTLNGSGKMQLNGEMPVDFRIHSDVEPIISDKQTLLPKSTLELTLSGALKNVTALTLNTTGGLNAALVGQVELAKDKMPLSLQLTADTAQYPFSATDPLKLSHVNLHVTGDLLDYRATLSAQAEGMGVPHTRLGFAGSGKLYEATIEKLQLNALDGSLNANGNAAWKDGVSWQGAVDLSKINVGNYVKSFPAVLSGKLSSDGQVNGGNWRINVPELDINGMVSKRPLALTGKLTSSQSELLNLSDLRLTYGDNKITAKGILSEKSDFKLDINAPDLRGLVPNLSASLNGKVALTGRMTAPDLDADLTGGQIQFQDLHLTGLKLKSKINSEPLVQGNADIALDGFRYGDGIRLNHATLTVKGDEKNHELHLHSQGEPVAANLDLTGNFDRTSQVWKGVIHQTDIHSPVGEFKNNQLHVTYDNKAVNANVSAHCWTNPDIELCFPKAFNAGKTGDIAFDLKKLDLNLVNKLTGNEMLKGYLRSQGNVAWFTDKPLKLDVKLDGNNINVAQKLDYRTFKLGIPKLSLTAKMENNNLNAVSDIQLQNQGGLTANLTIQDVAQGRKLGGDLNIHRLNLNLVNQLLSNGENVSGDVNANLKFAGNLDKPLLNGDFRINRINSVVNAMPFRVNNGELTLQFHGNRSTLNGYIQTPESRLNLDGDADWASLENWRTRVHAEAKNFYLNIPSMAKLKVSPDVEMKAGPTLLELTGLVDIPWGRIAIESLPESAVSVSSDEVILDDRTSRAKLTYIPAETKDGMAIRSDLKIHIGDDVNINAYGLNSQLEGLLVVKQAKGALGLYGGIDLKRGRYASFGQDLLIRKGLITFSGLPSQPMLNIEAIRNPEAMEDSKITAGIKVIGLADAPEVTVFSEPSMPQDQALSYILTGRSLENSGEAGSGGSIGAALLGMGLAKSGKVVGNIGETFGISDLNVGTAGVGDSSKVVVSGNLTKDLQIKYGVGLFDGLAEVTLRYRLLPRLYLQSVSGVNQAFDLLYQFEF